MSLVWINRQKFGVSPLRRSMFCALAVAMGLAGRVDLAAQPYVEGGATRHRFAQLNLGMAYRYLSPAGTESARLAPNDALTTFGLDAGHEAQLVIGGTHFWGHADFYVAIPVWRSANSFFSSGIETGAKYYPWRIHERRLRPYLGISLNAVRYRQEEGAQHTRVTSPLHAGLSYYRNGHLLEAGFGFLAQPGFTYYVDRRAFTDVTAHQQWWTLTYKRVLDTTLGAEPSWKSGRTQQMTDTLAARGRLNGWTLAAGPSSTWFTRSSDYNTASRPYLGQHRVESVFWDLAVGYYWHRPDIHLGLAYRRIKSTLDAYGVEQTLARRAFTLEGFHFLFDYHGFVPFVGPALSYESLDVTETDQGQAQPGGSWEGVRPGLTFGWDIRPNRLQTWVLRTNLRYFPRLRVNMPNGQEVAMDQIEFNFIQVVVYPGRW